jgi:hypothetical protein
MICDGIIQTLKGRFDTYVQYQDGHEMVGSFNTLAEAKREWAESHKYWNRVARNPEQAPVYQEQQMVVSRIARVR